MLGAYSDNNMHSLGTYSIHWFATLDKSWVIVIKMYILVIHPRLVGAVVDHCGRPPGAFIEGVRYNQRHTCTFISINFKIVSYKN